MTTVRELLTKWSFKADTGAVKSFEGAINHAKSAASTAAKGLGVLAAGAAAAGWGVFKLTEKIAENAHQIERMHSVTGVSTDMLQKLKFVADKSLVPFDSLTMGLRRFNTMVYSAEHGNKAAAKSLQAYGIELPGGETVLGGARDG